MKRRRWPIWPIFPNVTWEGFLLVWNRSLWFIAGFAWGAGLLLFLVQ